MDHAAPERPSRAGFPPREGVTMLNRIGPYWKAVVAFVAPGAVLIGAAVTPPSDDGTHVTVAEIITALVAAITTAAGVYQAPPLVVREGRHG
jgi:hypothetical protein